LSDYFSEDNSEQADLKAMVLLSLAAML
jgi:hypothetical protein